MCKNADFMEAKLVKKRVVTEAALDKPGLLQFTLSLYFDNYYGLP